MRAPVNRLYLQAETTQKGYILTVRISAAGAAATPVETEGMVPRRTTPSSLSHVEPAGRELVRMNTHQRDVMVRAEMEDGIARRILGRRCDDARRADPGAVRVDLEDVGPRLEADERVMRMVG